jgi:serine protease Do
MTLTSLTPALRKALDIEPQAGALIQDVAPDTPPERAGLRPYDVVVRVDGTEIRSSEDVVRYVSTRQPGTLASLEIWRDGESRLVPIKLRDRPLAPAIRRRTPPEQDVRPVLQDRTPLGLEVRDLDAATATRLRIPDSVQGVLITEVEPAGPARVAQLRANQVIVEINRRRVGSVAEYLAVLSTLRKSDAAAMLVYDRNTRQHVITTVIPDSEP